MQKRYGFDSDIENIIHKSGTVQEKQLELSEFKKHILQVLEESEHKITENYRYCKRCDKWFRKDSYDGNICPLGHFDN